MNTSAGTSVLSQIETSSFKFFLTGSQFFGNTTKESDYDFFVREDDSLYDWLEGLGFEMQGNDYGPDWREMGFAKRCSLLPPDHACDPTIKEVWLHGGNPNIHIQVIHRDMLEVKKIAQDIINSCNLLSRLAPRETLEWKGIKDGFAQNPNYKALSKAVWVSVIQSIIWMKRNHVGVRI